MKLAKLEDMPLPARLVFELFFFSLGVAAGFIVSYGWFVG